MNKLRIVTLFSLAVIALAFITSCSIKPHPNEQIIVGTWRPVKVEKIVDSAALEAAAAKAADTTRRQSKTGVPSGDGGMSRKNEMLDRLVQSEMRATMEIYANHTAVKNFPGRPLKASWKMKGRGKRIVAKNLENKMKFDIEILEIDKEHIVVIEHAPVGDVKITYERQQ